MIAAGHFEAIQFLGRLLLRHLKVAPAADLAVFGFNCSSLLFERNSTLESGVKLLFKGTFGLFRNLTSVSLEVTKDLQN